MTASANTKSIETQFGNCRLIVEYDKTNSPQWLGGVFPCFNVRLILPSGKEVVFKELTAYTECSTDGWVAFFELFSIRTIKQQSITNIQLLMESGFLQTVSTMFPLQMLDESASNLKPDSRGTGELLGAILATVIESFVIEIFLKQKSGQL